MSATLDESGTLLLDDNGQVVAINRGKEAYARAVECVWGNVVNLGLGMGEIRQTLLDMVGGETIASVRTIEESADVNDSYGLSHEADKDNPEVAGIAAAVSLGGGTWDSALFDLVNSSIFDNEAFQADLRTLFPDAGGRVVILTDRSTITLPGFSSPSPEEFDGQFLHIFDRFDPSGGIGEAAPHGGVYLPGFGWQE